MSRRKLVALIAVAGVVVVAAFVGVVLATSGSSSDELVVYSARSHYGEEQPFRDFAAEDRHRPDAVRRLGLRAVRAHPQRGRAHARRTC